VCECICSLDPRARTPQQTRENRVNWDEPRLAGLAMAAPGRTPPDAPPACGAHGESHTQHDGRGTGHGLHGVNTAPARGAAASYCHCQIHRRCLGSLPWQISGVRTAQHTLVCTCAPMPRYRDAANRHPDETLQRPSAPGERLGGGTLATRRPPSLSYQPHPLHPPHPPH